MSRNGVEPLKCRPPAGRTLTPTGGPSITSEKTIDLSDDNSPGFPDRHNGMVNEAAPYPSLTITAGIHGDGPVTGNMGRADQEPSPSVRVIDRRATATGGASLKMNAVCGNPQERMTPRERRPSTLMVSGADKRICFKCGNGVSVGCRSSQPS